VFLIASIWFTVFLMAVLVGEIYSQPVGRDLQDLAAAERAFAAETVKVGFRDGFIKFFADDGIGFGPHPERTKDVLQKRPAQTGPRTLVFNWQPMFGDISAAGDMGYTTGPVLFTPQGPDAKPPWHGIYFSVWQKQPDGTWKVAIDMGVDTPQAVAAIDTKFMAANARRRSVKSTSADKSDSYRSMDAYFASLMKANVAKAYQALLDPQFRIHRKGMMPITERADLVKLVNSATDFEFIDGKVASSDDLAFTYGKYTTSDETGYYVHVWRRDATGKWRLVVDVQNPLPKSKDPQ
jgi:ketosteroid isomerase-like protein